MLPQLAQAQSASTDIRDREARSLFNAGALAFEDGRFEDALGYFRHAYELSQRAALLYNIGQAADRLRRNQEALEAFESYVQALPDAPNRRQVEARIEVLRADVEREASVQAALTQEQQQASALAATPEHPSDDEGGSVFGEWWFWTLIGVVVAGGAVAITLVATSETTNQPVLLGDDGAIAMTLRIP